MAWTIALSFLFPKRDQPRRPFEGAAITSSFVGNGISMAHSGASGRQWGLAAPMVMVMADGGGDGRKELLRAARPLHTARLQTLEGGESAPHGL